MRFSTQEGGKEPCGLGLAGQAEPSPLVRLKLDFPSRCLPTSLRSALSAGFLSLLGVNNKTYSPAWHYDCEYLGGITRYLAR